MELRLERLDEAGVTVNQFVLLFLIESNLIPKCVEKKFDDLLKLQENLFIKILEDRIVLRPKGTQLIQQRNSPIVAEEIISLAKELREIFPTGTKNGTIYRWRGTLADVTNKLKKFMTAHPNYTRQEIVAATKHYVDSFKYGDMQYMQLLVYFIEKNSVSKLLEELEAIREGNVQRVRTRETSI